MRLQKYLADAGIASRRKCEELILAGRVEVNGAVAGLGMSVEPGDRVLFDGKEVAAGAERVVIAFYKPKNVICSNAADEDRVKVQDYFRELPYRLYTVGRLDYDSEGLILVTNDGDMANRLMHPRYGTSKTYMVLCTGRISRGDAYKLTHGVELEDGVTSPASLRILSNRVAVDREGRAFDREGCAFDREGRAFDRGGRDFNREGRKTGGNCGDRALRGTQNIGRESGFGPRGDDGIRTELLLTIHEGRNRQVRRMLAALGHKTLRLRRVSIGGLELGNLRPGQWRFLSEQEVQELLRPGTDAQKAK